MTVETLMLAGALIGLVATKLALLAADRAPARWCRPSRPSDARLPGAGFARQT